jgi:hypothetical protein
MNNLDAALQMAECGLYVFPCNDPTTKDKSGEPAGKRPRIKGWQGAATLDEAQIRTWWKQWPKANIGLDAGKSGLLIVDIDPAHGGTIEALGLSPKELRTVTAVTGSGGTPIFYRQPEGGEFGNSANRIAKGVDSRGAGGYVIGAGSVHPNGNPYRWADGLGPTEAPILELPASLAAKLRKEIPAPTVAPKPVVVQTPGDNRPHVQAALQRELEALAGAANGSRNHQLNRSAFSLGQFVGAGALAESEVIMALEHTALAIGLTETEARKTIVSGLANGKLKPRRIPEPRQRAEPHQMETLPKREDAPEIRKPGDDTLRDRWLKTSGRVVFGLGEWRRYHAGLWPVVKPTTIKREITRVLEAAKSEGVTVTANGCPLLSTWLKMRWL